jgi:tetratricopeptide (TPR) repeat protein
MRAWLFSLVLILMSAAGADKISPEVFRALKDAEHHLNANHPEESLKRLQAVSSTAKSGLEQSLLAAYSSYAYLSLARYQEAAQAAQKALTSPELPGELRPKLKAVLGQALLELKRFQEAAGALEAAGNEPEILYLAAYARYRLGQYERAAKILEQPVTHPPSDWQNLLLACYIQSQNFARALELIERELSRQPNNTDLWRQWLGLKLKSGRPQEALAAMVLAWHAGKLQASEFLDLARLYAAAGFPEKAARLIETWHSENRLPQTQETLRLEAELWLMARERQKALTVLERIASLSGKGSDWLAACRIAAELESWQEAFRLAQQALKAGLSDPSEAELWLGIAAYHLNDSATAKSALTRVQHSRLKPHAHYWLGCLHSKRRACR